jgi:hypothetical protein
MMNPMIGIRPIRIHQPLWSVSCSRRIATERPGSNRANPAIPLITPNEPIAASMMLAPIATRTANRNHHQYAGLDARPSNLT